MGGLGEAWALMARMEILLPRVLSIMKKMHITVTDAMHILNITDKGDQEYIIDHLKYTDIVQQSFQKQNMKLETLSKSLKLDHQELNYYEMFVRSLDYMKDNEIVRFISENSPNRYSIPIKIRRIVDRNFSYTPFHYNYYIIINNETILFELHSDHDKEIMSIIKYGINVQPVYNQSYIKSESIELIMSHPIVFYPKKDSNSVEKLPVRITGLPDDALDFTATAVYLDDYSFKDMVDNFMYPLLPFYPVRYEKILLNDHTEEDEKIIIEDLADAVIYLLQLQEKGTLTIELCSHICKLMSRTFRNIVSESMKMNKFLDVAIMNMCILEYSIDFKTFKKCYKYNEARKETMLKSIHAIMETFKLTEVQAMDALQIPEEDRNLLLPPKKPANTEE